MFLIKILRDAFLDIADSLQNYTMGIFNPLYYLEQEVLKSILPLIPDNAHLRSTGRLHLSMTQATDFSNKVNWTLWIKIKINNLIVNAVNLHHGVKVSL